MAQKVSILLVDDFDGSEASETVTFALDGTTYEIDVNDANAAALRDAMAHYVSAARKVSGGRGRKAGASNGKGGAQVNGSGLSREDRDAVRAWSRTRGASKAGVEPLGERGRIPESTVTAWQSR